MLGVIIPVFNCEATLDRCLQSVVNQTMKDLLIVLVENGSTDSSYNICNLWADKDERIKVIRSDKGVSRARNAGLDYVLKNNAEYFCFIDSDDSIEPNMYEDCISVAKDCHADIIRCGINLMKSDQKSTFNTPDYIKKMLVQKNLTPILGIYGGVVGGVYNGVFHNRLGNIRFDERMTVGEDSAYLLDTFACAEKIEFIDSTYYNYYVPQQFARKYYTIDDYHGIYFFEHCKNVIQDKQLLCFVQYDIMLNRIKNTICYSDDFVADIKRINSIEMYSKAKTLKNLLIYCHYIKGGKQKILAILIYMKMYKLCHKIMHRKKF